MFVRRESVALFSSVALLNKVKATLFQVADAANDLRLTFPRQTAFCRKKNWAYNWRSYARYKPTEDTYLCEMLSIYSSIDWVLRPASGYVHVRLGPGSWVSRTPRQPVRLPKFPTSNDDREILNATAAPNEVKRPLMALLMINKVVTEKQSTDVIVLDRLSMFIRL